MFLGSNTNPDDAQHVVIPEDDSHNSPANGDTLFVTINPANHEQFTHILDVDKRIDKYISHMKALLLHHLKGYEKYTFFLEQSLKGRLHLHGIIKIKDVKTLIHTLRLCAYTETLNGHKISLSEQRNIDVQKVLNTKEDHAKVLKYCSKDSSIYKEVITDQSQITLDDLLQNPVLQTYENSIPIIAQLTTNHGRPYKPRKGNVKCKK